MSRYQDLVDEFFTRYIEPEIEDLTVGFSGVDPPLKTDIAEADHEKLDGLLGGNIEGHYHLTKELWEKVIELLTTTDYDGGFPYTLESEYIVNEEYWFDGGFAGTSDTEYVQNQDKWADGGGAEW